MKENKLKLNLTESRKKSKSLTGGHTLKEIMTPQLRNARAQFKKSRTHLKKKS